MKDKHIGLIIYGNPSRFPPLLNAIGILSKDFKVLLICRNIGNMDFLCPGGVILHCLGKNGSFRKKETQSVFRKIIEFLFFIIKACFLIRKYRCRLIYSFDMHGFVAGFFASRIGRILPLVYHNLDLSRKRDLRMASFWVKIIELRIARFADKAVFPNFKRAKLFKKMAKLQGFPWIVMNAPRRIEVLPENNLLSLLQKNNFSLNSKVVLYQGSITADRFPLEVLESILSWPEDVILLLIGDYCVVNFKRTLKHKIKEYKLEQRVLHIPFVAYEHLFSLTVGAFLGLALFKGEDINLKFLVGASNKIFEYFACGVPPLVLDCSDMRSLFDESWVYFTKTCSPEDIAKVVNMVYSDPEGHKRKSQLCRRAHLEKFNFEIQFKPVIEYLQETV